MIKLSNRIKQLIGDKQFRAKAYGDGSIGFQGSHILRRLIRNIMPNINSIMLDNPRNPDLAIAKALINKFKENNYLEIYNKLDNLFKTLHSEEEMYHLLMNLNFQREVLDMPNNEVIDYDTVKSKVDDILRSKFSLQAYLERAERNSS